MSIPKSEVKEQFREWHKDSPNVVTPQLKSIDVVESLDGVPVVIERSKESERHDSPRDAIAVLVPCDDEYNTVKEPSDNFTSISTTFDSFTDLTGLKKSRENAFTARKDLRKVIRNLRVIE